MPKAGRAVKTKKDIPQPTNVVQLPPAWKSAFQGHAMRSSFCLALTQPMLEFLCATADGVHWDRRLYTQQWGIARPDNAIASSHALVKRGLIERLAQHQIEGHQVLEFLFHSHYRLTPAGEALVALLKVSGIFVEADLAVIKKAKG